VAAFDHRIARVVVYPIHFVLGDQGTGCNIKPRHKPSWLCHENFMHN